jgi:hypothetical protein
MGFNGDLFIFATLSGNIEGWRNALGTTAETLFTSPNSVYTGLATGAIGAASYLYGANFAQARIDVFGSTGAPALAGNFTDPNLPAATRLLASRPSADWSTSRTPRWTRRRMKIRPVPAMASSACSI